DPDGLLHQGPGVRAAFGLVTGEQVLPGPAVEHVRELPGQVVRVAQPGGQALADERRGEVRGVTEQEHAPGLEAGRQPGPEGVGRGADDLQAAQVGAPGPGPQPPPGRPCCCAQPDPRPAGGSGGQSGTASASFSATSFRSASRRASSSSCKALAMAASCSLATFTLASARPAWACSASAWALAAFAWVLASAWALAALAGDSRLGCLLTTVSWLRSLNERTCLALDHEAAAQRAAVCERSHAGDPRGTQCCPEASSNRSPPFQIEVHRLRLPSGGLGLSGPVSQG